MTDQHRATPEQWAALEEQSAPEYDNTILELRARVEALEASTACPYIVTSDEGTSYCRLAERVAAPTTAEAQPEPQGPTEAELKTFACEWWRSFGFAKDKATCTWVIDQVAPEHFADFSRDVLQRWHRPAIEPVPVSERLPEPHTKVIAHYLNDLGNSRTILAEWVPAKSRTDDCLVDDDFAEYDEEANEYYWPEGWYESIENWDDYGAVFVHEGMITHWQPLPPRPHHALPVPQQEVK
jgi:hypothetical protein